VKITKGYVRVYLKPGYWESGVLRDLFYEDAPSEAPLAAYFRSTNCEYDADASCFRFELPLLHDRSVTEEVYIPREFVLAICVRPGADVPEPAKIGFAAPARSAGSTPPESSPS
jgi:hypothetical protein